MHCTPKLFNRCNQTFVIFTVIETISPLILSFFFCILIRYLSVSLFSILILSPTMLNSFYTRIIHVFVFYLYIFVLYTNIFLSLCISELILISFYNYWMKFSNYHYFFMFFILVLLLLNLTLIYYLLLYTVIISYFLPS